MVRLVRVRSDLLPMLRSPLMGELLAWIYLHPEMSYSAGELARQFKVSERSVGKEADRLSEAGLVREERRGNLRLLKADLHSPFARPLTELLAFNYGPAAVLAELIPALPGVDAAYLYGPWAARYLGAAGPPPRDVEVLVVGAPDHRELADAAGLAERRLGREVNVHCVSVAAWRARGGDPFPTANYAVLDGAANRRRSR
ncbi:ArsR family transcriptional regulator [Paractinoplanes durhamensis]|uniref:ArsR family transcriptional regulator n=2 Tax=Paractinoplanes durhamensis TaxID=113563 RepID=A0ABQ3Z5Q4_9ACTN|nr:ArsR family transcriptional regulator [Actinoplanes durhamensis]